MTNPLPAAFCKDHGACPDWVAFVIQYPDMATVWDKCNRPDWMLWILSAIKQPLDDKTACLFACWCVRYTPLADGRTTWDLLTDERSRNAVVVSECFANGEATEAELAAAVAAAWAAAWAAAVAADRAAAGAAARAAAVAADRSAAGAAAGAAAVAAAWAAAGAADVAAAWAAQCNRIREVFLNPFLDAK
jgi:hypothetical protein